MLKLKTYEAYHGTSLACQKEISNFGFKIKKYSFVSAKLEHVPGDLGAGVYFYLNSIENAYKFALKENIEHITVLKSKIEVSEDHLLDMDEDENEEIFNTIRNNERNLENIRKRYTSNVGGKGRQCLDGVILEFLIHKFKLEIHLVKKKTYTPFNGLPRTSNFYNGIELCVKEQSAIKSTETVEYMVKR